MKKVLISQIGKSFSAIGLGCVTFGREINQSASFELLDFAIEHGVTFIDTAPSYGFGASEEIVGAWLSDRFPTHKGILIATKIQPPYEPKHILDSVTQSLKRLKVDCIDILYLHRWDSTIETPNALKAFDDLIKAGKIRMIGASNINAKQLNDMLTIQVDHGFECLKSVQNNNNFAVSDISKEIVQICVDHDIKIVTYSPLGAGFLTGKYKNGVDEGTRFSLVKEHQDIYFNETSFQRFCKLQEVSALTGYPTSYLALVWALHQAHITSVLVGGRSREQLEKAFLAFAFYESDIFNELELN
ncbi:MAG TPA: aldo/keto reductase [Hanamia sp.]|nr:aldo/keto reductase [Hanamia sp.]